MIKMFGKADVSENGRRYRTGFVQKLKCFFPVILTKTKFQGFPRLKNPFSRTFQVSRTRSIHKHGLHEVKKVHFTKSVISLSALQQRIENAIPEALLFYLTV